MRSPTLIHPTVTSTKDASKSITCLLFFQSKQNLALSPQAKNQTVYRTNPVTSLINQNEELKQFKLKEGHCKLPQKYN